MLLRLLLLSHLLQQQDQAWSIPVPGHKSWSRSTLLQALPQFSHQLKEAGGEGLSAPLAARVREAILGNAAKGGGAAKVVVLATPSGARAARPRRRRRQALAEPR